MGYNYCPTDWAKLSVYPLYCVSLFFFLFLCFFLVGMVRSGYYSGFSSKAFSRVNDSTSAP